MKGIKVSGRKINEVLTLLRENDAISSSYKQIKDGNTLTIAVNDDYKIPESLKEFIVEIDFEKKQLKPDFRNEAEKILTNDEIKKLKTAFDIVGEIAILEIDDVLNHKAKEIAEILLKCNNTVKTVVKKSSAHEGTLRLQKYDVLAGVNTLTTLHKENGCSLFITLDKVYYSARSATERKRVCEQIKKDENVLVMFSGAAPFVCVLAKNSELNNIIGIELNEVGHELGVKNIIKNKLKNADLIQGNVRDICPILKEKNLTFDRIIMPLPKTADEFLPEAFMVAKAGTVIHLYDFVDEREFPQNVIKKIDIYCKKENLNYEVLNSVKCGQFAPYIFRVCVDFKIL